MFRIHVLHAAMDTGVSFSMSVKQVPLLVYRAYFQKLKQEIGLKFCIRSKQKDDQNESKGWLQPVIMHQ